MSKAPGATPDQKKASSPEASAWVSANAGSGKTHVLVDRVIRLMLEGADPSTILCLTYTKAAATEMANRLHERLGEWIGLDDQALSLRLASIGCDRIDARIRDRARRLFTAALETPGGFKIQTIHAFCERILQLFPVEAGVAPGFEVLDQNQASFLLEQSRDFVLLRAQQDESGALAKAFAAIVRHAQTEAFDDLLDALMAKRRELQDILDHYKTLENVGNELKLQLGIGIDQTLDEVQEQFLKFDRGIAQRLASEFSSSGKRDQETGVRFRNLLNATEAVAASQAYRSIFYKSDGSAPKLLTSIVTKELRATHPWADAWLHSEYERVISLVQVEDNLLRIEATLALLRLAREIIAHFESSKQRRGAYDFEDLILRTRDLLTDRQAAQWVLYKLDRGFEHVLVDEAQDTSLAQWQIVNALTEEFFSGEGARARANRTFFVVGDHKQSIYSFQGADPAAFEFSRSKFRTQIQNSNQVFYDVDLTISYRSTAEILKMVDMVFAEGSRARIGLDGLMPRTLHHESNRKNQPGLFELWPLVRPEDYPDPEPWQAPVDREPAKSPRRILARKIAHTIKSWIGKRTIAALGRTVEPGDILILFRTRSLLFDALISELRKVGVPVAGADRLKLSKNIAVLDMMALARFVLLPEDDYSLACVLKSPLVPQPISEETLFDLTHGRGKASLWTMVSKSNEADCAEDFQTLKTWLKLSEHTRPFEFLSAVLTKSRTSILARLGSEAGDALDALLEASLTYEENYSSSLSGFADWFRNEDAEIKRNMESGRGEVRLMTVHGAKGLESNIVILPDTTTIPTDRKSSGLMFVDVGPDKPRIPLWRLAKLSQSPVIEGWKDTLKETGFEEYRRLLYVAMTRARDELYICGSHSKNELNENSWYAMVEQSLTEPLDGCGIWRHGPDPVWSEASSAGKTVAGAAPDWLRGAPAFPDIAQKSVAPTRLVQRRSRGSKAALSRGRVIHKLLQELPQTAPQKQLDFAHRILKHNNLDLTLADKIIGLIGDPEHRDFFGPGSQAEVTIGAVLPDGRRLTGQIDRLVMRENDILILDYKTDWDPPADLTPEHPYVLQLASYVMALGQAYENRPVRAALLWTSAPRLTWVPEDMMKSAISNMAAIT